MHVRFEDETAADVDLSYLLDYGGVFEPLRDPAFFGRLRAGTEVGTIVWPNGADIAPETLYGYARRRAGAPRKPVAAPSRMATYGGRPGAPSSRRPQSPQRKARSEYGRSWIRTRDLFLIREAL